MANFKRNKNIAGKHTTVIDGAKSAIEALRALPDTRITLGYITRLGGKGKRRVKYTNTLSGFHMKIVGNIYAQEFYVITKDPKAAIRAVQKVFGAHQ